MWYENHSVNAAFLTFIRKSKDPIFCPILALCRYSIDILLAPEYSGTHTRVLEDFWHSRNSKNSGTQGRRILKALYLADSRVLHTARKVSVLGVILVHIFPHSDWIRTRITSNTDTFYVVTFTGFFSMFAWSSLIVIEFHFIRKLYISTF